MGRSRSLEDGGEHAFVSEMLNGHWALDSEKTPNVGTFVISVEKESLGFLLAKKQVVNLLPFL